LDILATKGLIAHAQCEEGKTTLCAIAKMLVGLRRVTPFLVREETGTYGTIQDLADPPLFLHEKLNVYIRALAYVRWNHVFMANHTALSRHSKQLDEASTGMVLNIAEGNGRFAVLDHCRFLDIAHTWSLKAASCLDIVASRGNFGGQAIAEGKGLLVQIVSMLIAMRTGLLKNDRVE